jgi:hypothetical protein
MTWATFIDDILNVLGMGHDDRLMLRDGVLQNALFALHKINGQDLSAGAVDKGSDGEAYTHMESVVVVPVTYNATPDDTLWAYLWFDLPSEVYDLPHDRGIRFVRYHRPSLPVNCRPSIAGKPFTRTTLGSLSTLYDHRRQSPREDRPYYARATVGNIDRVYLFGVSPQITKVLVGLLYAPNFMDVSFDDDIPIDPAKLHLLKRMVLQMAVWPLSIPQERLKNDGRDFEPNQVINTRPIISVNDPAILELPQQP